MGSGMGDDLPFDDDVLDNLPADAEFWGYEAESLDELIDELNDFRDGKDIHYLDRDTHVLVEGKYTSSYPRYTVMVAYTEE